MIKITLENEYSETSICRKDIESHTEDLEEFVDTFIKGLVNLGYHKDNIHDMLESFVDEHNERKGK